MKKTKKSCLVLFLLVSTLLFFPLQEIVYSDTPIGGYITQNTTLYSSQSPFIATDDITIVNGVTLTIQNGVVIKFPRNYYGISVVGRLDAVGATFTADVPPTNPGDYYWQAIFFWPGSVGYLSNCTIEYAGSIVRQHHPDNPSLYLDALGNVVISGNAKVVINKCKSRYSLRSGIWTAAVNSNVEIKSLRAEHNMVDGLHCKSGSRPKVSGSLFRSNVYHGVELVNSSPSFSSCVFSGNPVGFHCLTGSNPKMTNCNFNSNNQYGVRTVDSSPSFISCTFSGNSRDGLWTVNSRPTFSGGHIENNVRHGVYITGSKVPSLNGILVIAGNGQWGVKNQTNKVVSAQHIYWGDPTGPYDNLNLDGLGLLNPDGLGDNVSEFVDWSPFRSDIIQTLIDHVEYLRSVGALNRGNSNALIKKLEGAIKSLDKGNINSAKGKLNAFINQVKGFINSRKLTSEQGQPLIDLAKECITQINCLPKRDISNQSVTSVLPTAYKLGQNYPNPFNPETEISFQLPEANRVQITIYNSRGQVIRRLVDQIYNAGTQAVQWDGQDELGVNVSSGIYLYRMQAGEFVTTKKMILTR